MHVAVDAAGNLRGLFSCGRTRAPRLIIGSHLDTVPDAGAFDGVLGVVIGVGLVVLLARKFYEERVALLAGAILATCFGYVFYSRRATADIETVVGVLAAIYLYGHNQGLRKGVGDWVEAGEVIASLGNTGDAAKPGLYFEIRQNGAPRDPLIWCKTR